MFIVWYGNAAAINQCAFFLPLVLVFRCLAREGASAAQERDEDQRGAIGPGQEYHPQRGAAGTNQGRPSFLRDDAAGVLFSLLVYVSSFFLSAVDVVRNVRVF